MSGDPKAFNLPEVKALRPEQLDNVARALLSLAREVCVLQDRVMVLERVLADKGIAVTEAIEGFQPDADFDAQTNAAMARIVGQVIDALKEG